MLLSMKNERTKVKIKVTLRLTVSHSVSLGVEPHLGLMTRYLLLWQLRSYGKHSLTRGRICLLYMLLALASAVIFGSSSLRTRGHILLSQIRDFLFRRLLRLAGSRWRYSTPPPHGNLICWSVLSLRYDMESTSFNSRVCCYCAMEVPCHWYRPSVEFCLLSYSVLN
jgi:hypothetical protein